MFIQVVVVNLRKDSISILYVIREYEFSSHDICINKDIKTYAIERKHDINLIIIE